MIKSEKKHVKIFSILIAVVPIGSCVAIGVSQMGSSGVVSAASSAVGKIGLPAGDGAVTRFAGGERPSQQAVEDAKKDFEESPRDERSGETGLLSQTQSRLQKQQTLSSSRRRSRSRSKQWRKPKGCPWLLTPTRSCTAGRHYTGRHSQTSEIRSLI